MIDFVVILVIKDKYDINDKFINIVLIERFFWYFLYVLYFVKIFILFKLFLKYIFWCMCGFIKVEFYLLYI